jgi:2'-hydroxyisoflavone reductase
VGAIPLIGAAGARAEAPRKSGLRVLVLGGTGQTGPHFIECALAQGHEITMLNRGNRSEDLFPDVECIIGDRDPAKADGMDALKKEIDGGRKWDVAVDIWPHVPKMVENAANLVKPAVGHYMYVSSISVYTDDSQPNQDETGPVGEAPDADNQEYTMERFGPFKAECENRVRRIFPDNHTIFRPGLIVGPRDWSHRGVYWPRRVREGGAVVAPPAADRLQFIDGRDLVAFEVACMERGVTGTFNVIGPHPRRPLTFGAYLAMCKGVSKSDAEIVHMPAAFLEEQGVAPWTMLPCWLPQQGESAGFAMRSVDRAVGAGLTFRPVEETIRDTYAWWDAMDDAGRERSLGRGFGVPKEKEAEVVAAWRKRQEG